MKAFLKIMAGLVLVLLLAACKTNNGVSGDPNQDADRMCEEMLKAAQENDIEAAKQAMTKYYDYYKSAEIEDQVAFVQSVHENEILNNPEFRKLAQTKAFQKLAINKKFDKFYRTVREKGRKEGIW